MKPKGYMTGLWNWKKNCERFSVLRTALDRNDMYNDCEFIGQQKRKGIKMQQNIYDNDTFFENFRGLRSDEINFNEVIESPIITAMLPDLKGRKILDIGCGMGQHAMQYSKAGAASVLGIDISEKMLAFAKEKNSADNITYRRLAFEDLDKIDERFDLITSSLAFDYSEDFGKLMKEIYALLDDGGYLVFSTSHPISTAYDGVYDRYTRTEDGVRLYANLHNYGIEGERHFKWVVEDYEVYHRMISTLINCIAGAGFVIEECRESKVPDDILAKYPDRFGGVVHQPDFIFFRCRK